MPPPKYDKKAKKATTLKKLYELLSKHKTIVIVSLENVGSNQVQQIRRVIFQGKGRLVIGKNTLVRKAVTLRANNLPEGEEWDWYRQFGAPIPELNTFLPLLKEKIGFVFTDEPVWELKPKIEANKVAAPARAGTFAPIDVTIEPGSTGMDPSQISFFHALSMSTKINKGQIEITKEYKVCTAGKKIGNSEVALLEKMGMKPFSYGMKVLTAYDDGAVLTQEVISLDPNNIINKFQEGVRNLTAISLEAGIPTELAVPHLIIDAFKNLAAIGLTIGHEFKQLKAASSAPKASAPAKDDKKAEAPKKDAKKAPEPEPPKEEEEDVDMGGLFD